MADLNEYDSTLFDFTKAKPHPDDQLSAAQGRPSVPNSHRKLSAKRRRSLWGWFIF